MRVWSLKKTRLDLSERWHSHAGLPYLAAILIVPPLACLSIEILSNWGIEKIQRANLYEPTMLNVDSEIEAMDAQARESSLPLIIEVARAALVAFGIFVLYTRNGGRKGMFFFERTLALLWVCGVRATVANLGIFFAAVFAFGFPFWDSWPITTAILEATVFSIITMAFAGAWWNIGHLEGAESDHARDAATSMTTVTAA